MNSFAYKAALRYGRTTSSLPWTFFGGRNWAQRLLIGGSSFPSRQGAVVAKTRRTTTTACCRSSSTSNSSRCLSSLPVTPDMNHVAKDHHQALPSHNGTDVKPLLSSMLDLNDARTAYHDKSGWELVRAYLVFRLCQVPFLVTHAESLLSLCRKVVGNTLTDGMMKATFYGHFCAGKDEEAIRPVIKKLANANIGGIFDYAAESDEPEIPKHNVLAAKANNTAATLMMTSFSIMPPEDPPRPVARVYDYESEARCDQHVEVFRNCIRSVQSVSSNGFAAVKITALGNPELLSRISKAIVEAKNLFAKFDLNQDGLITTDEFERAYRYFFNDSDCKLEEILEFFDPQHSGKVDYISWSKCIRPQDLPKMTKRCRQLGPLVLATPTDEELELIDAMFARGHKLAEEAARCGTRLLIDAEQTRFQPAIDNLVLDLQQKYNATSVRDTPLIYNTYQCYLKDAPERLHLDVERSERFSFHFGAKLVRGAYVEGERARAKARGELSPIHDTIEDTHKCYNDAVRYLLEKSVVPSETKLEFMCATHNQRSIELAAKLMDELGIPPYSSTIYFAQLYGMADHLTYNLGKQGYHVYKYVPYGEVKEVMPYLLRRAQENSAVVGSASHELRLLRGEMSRRMGMAS